MLNAAPERPAWLGAGRAVRRVSLRSLETPALVVLVVIGTITVLPLVVLVVDTFTRGQVGESIPFNLDAWPRALGTPGLLEAIGMTALLVVATQAISLPLGVTITWLMARTNVRLRKVVDLAMWCSFFLPALAVMNGWVLLLDPQYGLINDFLRNTLGLDVTLNIYSFWGIVWIHLVTKSISSTYILLTPTFRSMDSALEDASRMCGARLPYTLMRISLPMLAPSILMIAVLSAVYAVESFEPELLLGGPAGIDVFSTLMYGITNQQTPQYTDAKVLGLAMLALMLPGIVLYQAIARRRTVALVSGGARIERRVLRPRNRVLLTAVLAVFAALITVVPLVFLLMGTFMSLFGFFDLADPWTLGNWTGVLSSPDVQSAILSTLKVAVGGSVLGTAIYVGIAYVVVRRRGVLSHAADLMSWTPIMLPGLVFGLGLLATVLRVPGLNHLYGTVWILVVAVVVASMTHNLQLLKVGLGQQKRELDEASAICGGTPAYTFRRVTLPLLAPTILTVAVLTFAVSAANVTHVVLLSTPGNMPLPVLQLGYMATGSYEKAAVIGTLLVVLSMSFALVARAIARRWERA